MTKQEEIRDMISKVVDNWNPTHSVSTEWKPLYGGVDFVSDLIFGLHSKGVVIKVDSKGHESQECNWCYWSTHKVEPLIEVSKQ